MKVIPIKGTIVSNDDVWLYDWFGWDCTAPKTVVLPKSILHYGPTQGK